MPDAARSADPSRVSTLLHDWIAPHLDEQGRDWLREAEQQLAAGAPDWRFFTSFSAVPRYTGKADLALDDEALSAASTARPGWDPSRWSVDQAARTLLVLALPAEDPDAYAARLDAVFETADVGESVALYQALPLLPHPEALRPRAIEGLRTNMTSVFAAIALRNPYPAERFDDDAWNQMVLKAVFVGLPLGAIQGFDERANSALARMLVDYVHERWAAGRDVAPDLWRGVAPFAEGAVLDDLDRALASERPAERLAAALALARSPAPDAPARLDAHPDLHARVERGADWDDLDDRP